MQIWQEMGFGMQVAEGLIVITNKKVPGTKYCDVRNGTARNTFFYGTRNGSNNENENRKSKKTVQEEQEKSAVPGTKSCN